MKKSNEPVCKKSLSDIQNTESAYVEGHCESCPTKSRGFLCSTSDEISKTISQIKVDCHYKAGEFIFHAGTQPVGLFSIRSGVVKIENLSSDGQAHTVRLVGAGGALDIWLFLAETNTLTRLLLLKLRMFVFCQVQKCINCLNLILN